MFDNKKARAIMKYINEVEVARNSSASGNSVPVVCLAVAYFCVAQFCGTRPE